MNDLPESLYLLQALKLTDTSFPWSTESIKTIDSYSDLIELGPVAMFIQTYPEIYLPGDTVFNPLQRKFCGYIMLDQKRSGVYGAKWITPEEIHAYWVEILLLSLTKHLEISTIPASDWNYPLDRIRAYLPDPNLPFGYIWIVFCGIRKLVQLRDIYTAWYPDLIYVHAINKLDFLPGDAPVFKDFLGKEYRNMMRFLLICLSDLIKDFPPSGDHILARIKDRLIGCKDIPGIKEFLGRLYMQLLIITTNQF